MKRTVLLSAMVLAATVVQARDINYVGGGRYTCHDSSAACAIIKQNNRVISHMEREAARRPYYVNPDPTFSTPRSGGYVSHHEKPSVKLQPKANLTADDFKQAFE